MPTFTAPQWLHGQPLLAMNHAMLKLLPVAAALALSLATAAAAQQTLSAPVAAPVPRNIPDAVDTPYPGGTIKLDIDATDLARGVYRVTETIPVAPGTTSLVLEFPQWLPGNHGPRGPMAELVDIRFLVDGKPLAWRRDPVEVYAFHLDLPRGTREVVARFLHTSPLQTSEGRITMTQEMLNLQWEKMSLYPAGHYVRRIRIKPSVTFPAGFTAATALDGQSARGGKVTWAETSYEVLVDSPIFAGKHYRKVDLGNRVTMHAIADSPELLALKPEDEAKLRAMVSEAIAAYGSRHFDHYELLVALTDRMGSIGLEHHRSSENQLEPKSFVDWDTLDWDRNVLAHELSHSWDGKFRRPAGLWTPDYREPMRDTLLWVYEGQDQFWGNVIAARSGLQKKETVLGAIAQQAGAYAEQPGRGWRSVEDTTYDPVFGARKAKPYATLARGEDYYNEGMLIWLEADQIIRQRSGGAKSIDDFAKAFFGIRDGDWGQVTYTFDDVVDTLGAIQPYDWRGFLETRINRPNQPAPLRGIEMGGYRLVWKDTPNPYTAGAMANDKSLSLTHSLGIGLDKDGKVTSTQWNGPAFNAGIVNGAKLVAVNGETYSADRLKAAIAAKRPVALIVQRGERMYPVEIDYRGGLRWPWLEKAGAGEGGLDRLLAPKTRPVN